MATDLVLYQVGLVQTHMHPTSVVTDYSLDNRGKNKEMLGSINFLSRDTPYLFKPRKIKYKSVILNNRFNTASDQINALKSMVGQTVPIFGYIATGIYEQANVTNYCCGCGGCTDDCQMTFLQAVGKISKFDDSRIRDPFRPQEISFEIELLTFWKGIDNVQWQISGSSVYRPLPEVRDITTANINTYKSMLPDCITISNCIRDCKAFAYRQVHNCLWRFDVDIMPLIATQSYTDPISNAVVNCGGEDIGVFKSTPDGADAIINSNKDFWNAPPLSYYLLNTFAANTEILITIRDHANMLNIEERQTRVDITNTNVLLTAAGLPVLDDATDIIVIGDFKLKTDLGNSIRNSAIIRNGSLLDEVQPIVTFDGYFPAMLYPDYRNQITFNGARADHIHFYRKL